MKERKKERKKKRRKKKEWKEENLTTKIVQIYVTERS